MLASFENLSPEDSISLIDVEIDLVTTKDVGLALGGNSIKKVSSFTGREFSKIVKAALKKTNFETVQLVVPENIELLLQKDLSKKYFENKLLFYSALICPDCKFTVSDFRLPKLAAEQELASVDFDFSNYRKLGSFVLPTKLTYKNTTAIDNSWTTGSIKGESLGLMTTKSLTQGTSLSSADFKKVWVDITNIQDGIATEVDLKNMISSRFLPINKIILKGDLARALLIKKGQIVQVTSGDDRFEISKAMVAEDNGYFGELIKLKNAESNKIIMGRVSDAGKVVVD